MAQNYTTGFIANAGQMKATDGTLRSDLLFTTQVQGAKVFLTKTGINYVWYQSAIDTTLEKDSTYRMEVEFKNSNANVTVQSSDVQPSYSNYFIGNISAANVAEYGKITYKNLWPNIDLELTSDNAGFNFNYILAKGANPADIQLMYKGGKKFTAKNGGYSISVPYGASLELSKLSIKKTSISKSGGSATVSSLMGANNTAQISSSNMGVNDSYSIMQTASAAGPGGPIVPIAQSLNNKWSTYYGGSLIEQVKDVFVTSNDFIYVVGETYSTNFPSTINESQVSGDNCDIFINMFGPDRRRYFSTIFGGLGPDFANSVVVNSMGDIIFTGYTQGSSTYPKKAVGSEFTDIAKGSSDAYITRISKGGDFVKWSTLLSSRHDDKGYGLSIGLDDKVYTVGHTRGLNFPNFPLAGGYNQDKYQIGIDSINVNTYPNDVASVSYIMRFGNTNRLEWSTFFGIDLVLSIASLTSCTIDKFNNLFVYGITPDFCGVGNGIPTQNSNGVFNNCFPYCTPTGAYFQSQIITNQNSNIVTGTGLAIVKFNSLGKVTWGTQYFAEIPVINFNWVPSLANTENVTNAITTDNNGDVYITGNTQANFPTMNNAGANIYNQASYGGGNSDAFLVRFDNNGVRKYATYLGGSGDETGWAIQPTPRGFMVVGSTTSSNFPVQQNPSNSFYYGTRNGPKDGFLSDFNNDNSLSFCSYIGGSNLENIHSLGMGINNGNYNVTLGGGTGGGTGILGFPVKDITPGTIDYFDGSYNGGTYDGFIMNLQFCVGLQVCARVGQVLEKYNKATIYPNPTSNSFSVEIDDQQVIKQISIYDNLGRLIEHQNLTNLTNYSSFNIENYKSGMYSVRITTDKGVETHKIIVQ